MLQIIIFIVINLHHDCHLNIILHHHNQPAGVDHHDHDQPVVDHLIMTKINLLCIITIMTRTYLLVSVNGKRCRTRVLVPSTI